MRSVLPITSAVRFREKLEAVASSVVDPPVGGLDFRTVLQPGADSGVVAVWVPESSGGPHRATAGKEYADRYFMRTGASTVRMPHALLRDRFLRAQFPELRLVADFVHVPGSGPTLNLRTANIGRAAAIQPLLRLSAFPNWLRWNDVPVDQTHFERRYARGVEGHGQQYAALPGLAVYSGSEVWVYIAQPSTNAGGQEEARLAGEIHALNMAEPHRFDVTVRLREGPSIA